MTPLGHLDILVIISTTLDIIPAGSVFIFIFGRQLYALSLELRDELFSMVKERDVGMFLVLM